jgi:hypothetical protein
MKQSFVKMMNRIAEMENSILKGLVLDESGNWVPIADRKAVEEETLAHLSSGQVLFEGRWVNFPELKKSRSRRVEKPPLFAGRRFFRTTTAAPVSAPQPAPTSPDTSLITMSPEPETTTAGEPPPEKKPLAPETSLIIMAQGPEKKTAAEPPPEKKPLAPETSLIIMAQGPEKKTAAEPPPKKEPLASVPVSALETSIILHEPPPLHTHPEDGLDEFAPETKIILFKPPEQPAHGTSDTRLIPKPGDTQILHLPKPAPAQEETPATPKNRIVLIVGAVAAAAVIAAILFVVVQMVR